MSKFKHKENITIGLATTGLVLTVLVATTAPIAILAPMSGIAACYLVDLLIVWFDK